MMHLRCLEIQLNLAIINYYLSCIQNGDAFVVVFSPLRLHINFRRCTSSQANHLFVAVQQFQIEPFPDENGKEKRTNPTSQSEKDGGIKTVTIRQKKKLKTHTRYSCWKCIYLKFHKRT